eukprot:TRINITY_DN18720_c0_g1::TRINITY_DN18720_c0_g1_i1::g.20391::m.20391 TRINITY_DN18720_c0_g1::TRINITY_DN18720_c0_g1_i1::g.20391  ORF type:complete len:481 (+),score=192.98,sp/Q2KI84/SYHC_BOVIN/55.23/6e-178,tRNA-synt_His/PF13393.1/2.3e-45,HGTP_anticodon/PF03129.15/6.3e-14,tRNA-synt_2b/PF00587.20/1.2e-13,tRNA-synt_2/PF00152.15/3.7e-05,tRNA-synt_2/PF00152.15/27,HGTP_anticodon2/PF12745.2/0.025,tRNA-synt_2d/PF01409.15/0.052,tRNA-synt_2d/PF01409.15/2.6e+03 TRINITY_DN18720_c0_g1_i1:39-1445(+)
MAKKNNKAEGEEEGHAPDNVSRGGERRLPKVPKGARDFGPEQMAIREKAFKIVTGVFKRHGAVSIDTPVFELKETLTGKYGEDSKLIFDLADQGGEILSLRYDLTVPFARFLALNNVGNIKRYHIARVYRRDQPALAKGRFREFYQCDFDMAGTYAHMFADSEVLKVMTEILDEVPIGGYEIKINHRKLLDAMMSVAGVPTDKFRAICSSIDKLDKETWAFVKDEMVKAKGLDEAVADAVGEFVRQNGQPWAMLETLEKNEKLTANAEAKTALEDMRTLFKYLEAYNCLPRFSFDLSLARGLDYYTGVIYEAVLTDPSTGVGSIAAGGRYDGLVGMFNPRCKDLPCVGVSIGIERVLAIMEKKEGSNIRQTETQVLVAAVGADMDLERMKLAAELWAGDVKAEILNVSKPKMDKQLKYALDQGIPYMLIVGGDEVAQGVVKLKTLAEKKEEVIPRGEIVVELKNRLAK